MTAMQASANNIYTLSRKRMPVLFFE